MNKYKDSFVLLQYLILLASCLNYAFAGEQEIKTGFDRDIRKSTRYLKITTLKIYTHLNFSSIKKKIKRYMFLSLFL